MSTGARLTALFIAAVAAWGAFFLTIVVYVNWFSEKNRSGEILLQAAWVFFLLLGLGTTFVFLASAMFAVVDRVRGHA